MRFAGSKTGVDFQPVSLASAGTRSGAASAASAVDINDTLIAQKEKAPRFDELSAAAMQTQSAEKQAAMNAEASVVGNGVAAFGQTKGSALQAAAAVEAAEIQAEASKQNAMTSGAFGAIGSIGSALIGLSDESTKDAITPIDTALEKLRQLKPVTFYYKKEYGDPKRRHHGFVAQEFKQVLPDATYVDEKTGKLCIDTMDVIGLLVRGNQELQARVSRLEAKAALQAV
jgi:hypothetical protein